MAFFNLIFFKFKNLKVSHSSFNVKKTCSAQKNDPIGPDFRSKTGSLVARESKSQTKVGVIFENFNLTFLVIFQEKNRVQRQNLPLVSKCCPQRGFLGLEARKNCKAPNVWCHWVLQASSRKRG